MSEREVSKKVEEASYCWPRLFTFAATMAVVAGAVAWLIVTS